jgi:hypothetical protein
MVKDCGEMGWVKDCGMRGVKYMRRDRRVRNEVEEEAIVGRWREPESTGLAGTTDTDQPLSCAHCRATKNLVHHFG